MTTIVKAHAHTHTVKHSANVKYDSSSISWTRTKTGEIVYDVSVIAEDETSVIATKLIYEHLVGLYIDDFGFDTDDGFDVATEAQEKAYRYFYFVNYV